MRLIGAANFYLVLNVTAVQVIASPIVRIRKSGIIVDVVKRRVYPEMEAVLQRLESSESPSRLDFVVRSEEALDRLAEKVGRPGFEHELIMRMRGSAIYENSDRITVVMNRDFENIVDLPRLRRALSRTHLDLWVKRGHSREEDQDLIRHFAHRDSWEEFHRGGKVLLTSLLPPFARKWLGKFRPMNGPNCFQAAAAFHGLEVESSSNWNVRKEPDHDEGLLNSDEMKRVLDRNFYAVEDELTYGDVLVFGQGRPGGWSYRDLKHATVYLFDGFTFSKGSKSANSPYRIQRLSQEWLEWKRRFSDIEYRVYRKSENTSFQKSWLY